MRLTRKPSSYQQLCCVTHVLEDRRRRLSAWFPRVMQRVTLDSKAVCLTWVHDFHVSSKSLLSRLNQLCTVASVCVLLPLSVYCSICLCCFVCLCTAPSVCVLLCLSMYCSVCLCAARSVCVLLHLSVYCSVCLCTAPSVCVMCTAPSVCVLLPLQTVCILLLGLLVLLLVLKGKLKCPQSLHRLRGRCITISILHNTACLEKR